MTLEQDIMNLIAEQIDEMFGSYFEGKVLLMTFKGEVVSIHDDITAALKTIQGKLTENKIFVHEVNGDRH